METARQARGLEGTGLEVHPTQEEFHGLSGYSHVMVSAELSSDSMADALA